MTLVAAQDWTVQGSVLKRLGRADRDPSVLQLIDPATPTGQQPTGLTGRTLKFSDEFNGTTLDSKKWDKTYPAWPRFLTQSPGGNRVNTSTTCWFADDAVTLTGDGSLDLACTPDTTTYPSSALVYKSGMVQSLKSYTVSQGSFVESRIRMSALSDRSWPAAWMSNSATDQWPPEIDYFEKMGSGTGYITNIYQAGGGSAPVTRSGTDLTAWHTYGVDWQAAGVTFYLDGVKLNATPQTGVSGSQYLLLDYATQAGSSALPALSHMYVDYIRAWG